MEKHAVLHQMLKVSLRVTWENVLVEKKDVAHVRLGAFKAIERKMSSKTAELADYC